MQAKIRRGKPSPPPPDMIDVYRYSQHDYIRSYDHSHSDWWALTISQAEELRDQLTDALHRYRSGEET